MWLSISEHTEDIHVDNTYANVPKFSNGGINNTITRFTYVSNNDWPPAALKIMQNAGRTRK